jgi:hypothetical protein
MKLNDLKWISIGMIQESKLDSKDKTRLYSFLRTASEAQIKNLILTGKMTENLSEHKENYIHMQFEKVNLSEDLSWLAIIGLFAAARAISAAADEKVRRCGIVGMGPARKVCIWKAKAEEAKKLAAAASSGRGKCKGTKNPEACMAKAKKYMEKYTAKARKFEQKIKNYAAKNPMKATAAKAGEKKYKDPSTKIY